MVLQKLHVTTKRIENVTFPVAPCEFIFYKIITFIKLRFCYFFLLHCFIVGLAHCNHQQLHQVPESLTRVLFGFSFFLFNFFQFNLTPQNARISPHNKDFLWIIRLKVIALLFFFMLSMDSHISLCFFLSIVYFLKFKALVTME